MSEEKKRYATYHASGLPTSFPTEVEVTTLRDEPNGGPRTILVHIPPGGSLEPHAHTATVQHFVLGGAYEQDGEIYEAGMYRIVPDHSNQAALSSENGALVLMVFDPVG